MLVRRERASQEMKVLVGQRYSVVPNSIAIALASSIRNEEAVGKLAEILDCWDAMRACRVSQESLANTTSTTELRIH